MRRRIFLVAMVAGVLASCGDDRGSAESEATNATLLDDATVNALLGTNLPPEQPVPGNDTGNEVVENEADAPANETD